MSSGRRRLAIMAAKRRRWSRRGGQQRPKECAGRKHCTGRDKEDRDAGELGNRRRRRRAVIVGEPPIDEPWQSCFSCTRALKNYLLMGWGVCQETRGWKMPVSRGIEDFRGSRWRYSRRSHYDWARRPCMRRMPRDGGKGGRLMAQRKLSDLKYS